MMRQIKLRGWNGKKMDKVHRVAENGIGVTRDNNFLMPSKNSAHFIMQFVGLTDANDREIYEGDILQCDEGCLSLVYWDDDYYGFQAHDKTMDRYLSIKDLSKRSVIGNIHENPELLESDDE